jgi:hypothetical protein
MGSTLPKIDVVSFKYVLVALLTTFLSGPARADQLWVSNQPFPGAVRGLGQDMSVELRMFVKLLDIEVDDQGEVVVVGGFPIPVEESGGVRFVHLRDIVDAAGLKISTSPELGTVDVRRASAGTGYKGEWNALSSDQAAGGSIEGTVTTVAADFFSMKIPSHLLVVAEPEYLQSGESTNAKAAVLNDNRYYSGARTVCAVSVNADMHQGGLVMSLVYKLPEKVTSKNETEVLDTVKDEMLSRGVQQIGPMSSLSIAGNRFHRIRVRQTEKGRTEDTEVNIHFSNKHDVMVLFMIRAPKSQFARVAPQLRLILNSFRIQ